MAAPPRQSLPTMYVCLFLQTNPLAPHWAIVVGPKEDFEGKAGKMYHAVLDIARVPPGGGPPPRTWKLEVRETASRTNSMLIRLVIGKIKPNVLDKVEKVLESVPVQQGNPNWNCLSWLEAALNALKTREAELFSMALLSWREVNQTGAPFYVDKLATGYFENGSQPATYDVLEHKEI